MPAMSQANSSYDYDVAIIGGGSGGYAAARTVAAEGFRTVVLEGGKEVGGLCILRGCMPTKALLQSSDVLHLIRQAGTWGIHAPEVRFDFSEIMSRKDRLIQEFAQYRRNQLSDGQFSFIRALGRFTDDHTIALNTGGKLTARYFVISTGSIVSPPPLAKLKEIGYLTSDSAISITKLPKSLIVLGGGPVAVELAQFFARLDVKVTLIQRSSHVLRQFDADLAEVLERVLKRDGLTLFTETRITDAWREGGLKALSFVYQGQTVRVAAEEILLALGRTPNTAYLDLEMAGVFTEGGRILANTEMQTTAHHIYAAGDCTGPHEIVHIAVQQGELAGHNIVHPAKKKSIDYRLMCSVVFTDPQVAVVGLSENEAQARKIPYLAAHYPFNDHGKSIIMDVSEGFVKLLANPSTGEILGGSVAGPIGGELIHEITVAMHHRMTVQEFAAIPHYHPTLAEIWTYPAEELASKIAARK